MPEEIRLVIADDHPLMRDALRRTIEAEPGLRVVAEAGDGREALQAILDHQPDLAILDIDMPGLDGFAVVRALRDKGQTVPVVVLTVHDDPAFFETALELGVKGYILKDSRASDIVAGVQAVASGQVYASPALTNFLFDRGRRPSAPVPDKTSGIERLTPTERRVLALVAAYKTSSAIAEDLGISVRTVQTHRANICEKLGIEGSHALMKFALENAARLLAD
jgi:DNA-binding NarL/FixJ family response regulator